MELNKLYNMDCLIGMQEIPSGSVDLIICDPPYGTIKSIGKGTDKFNKDTTWDEVIPTDLLFDQYARILRNKGTLVLFSQEPYTMHLRTFKCKNLKFSYPMIWLKNGAGNPLNAKRAPLSYFEDISVWRKRVDIVSKEQPTGGGEVWMILSSIYQMAQRAYPTSWSTVKTWIRSILHKSPWRLLRTLYASTLTPAIPSWIRVWGALQRRSRLYVPGATG